MRWGTKIEPLVRQEFSNRTGRTIELHSGILRHPKHRFLIANVDGISDGCRVLECKTARSADGWGEPGTDEIPQDYLVQVNHYLVVTGLEVADVAVLIGGSDFRIYTVEADAEFQALLIEQEAAFWRHVERGIPPDPVNPEDVKRRWRTSSGTQIVTNEATRQAVNRLAALKAQIKEAEEIEKELTAAIQTYMTDNAELTCAGEVIATWRQTNASRRFDLERFREECPDVHAKYLFDPAPSRRFLLKKAKGE
jgi:predicted phage-related endonuclease